MQEREIHCLWGRIWKANEESPRECEKAERRKQRITREAHLERQVTEETAGSE